MAHLKKWIQLCKNDSCTLHDVAMHRVPGHGNYSSNIMIVGEAPGREEDISGLPFVGRSGKMLNKILEEAGFVRKELFVTNIVKCRPPDNRKPTPWEVEQCKGYFESELFKLQPEYVVPLGNTAWQHMSQLMWEPPMITISKARGNIYDGISREPYTSEQTFEIKIFPTFHPSYALRNPAAKALMVMDFKKLYEITQDSDKNK